MRMGGGMPPGMRPRPPEASLLPWWPALAAPGGLGIAALLLVLFAAIAAGAWPVVRRLTRRLEALKQGVEAFGAGALHHRVAEDGRDEVAALGASFNRAAARIEALLRSQQSLLANASHELRSPLARLKMAVAMLEDAPPASATACKREIHTNIGELDALVEEVLLASRLEAGAALPRQEPVELLALAAEEAARIQASVEGEHGCRSAGDERLLRRALRNLLENAQRYGGGAVSVERAARCRAAWPSCGCATAARACPRPIASASSSPSSACPAMPSAKGGVGLGLALVRQIAGRHGGSVRCEPREGGGSCFRLSLPAA